MAGTINIWQYMEMHACHACMHARSMVNYLIYTIHATYEPSFAQPLHKTTLKTVLVNKVL